jgi:hypothetical protein
MIVFDTDKRRALAVGILGILLMLVGIGACIALAVLLPRSLVTHLLLTLALGMLVAIGWLAYHTVALSNTSYALDRNAFVIRWGPVRQIIPMGEVQRVIAATDVAQGLKLTRLPLPSWWMGQGWHAALGRIFFYANAPLRQQVIIVTADANYAISPADNEGFLNAFRMRFEMGPTQSVQATQLLPRFLTLPLWRDRIAHVLVLIAIGLNALLFAIGFARYPVLPPQVVLHFDALGVADRLGPRDQVFGPAIIAFQLFLINFLIALGVYARGEKLAAYLAWSGSAVVQLFFVIAMLTVAFTG